MPGKFSYKDVKTAIKYTPKDYNGKSIHKYRSVTVGYYQPSNANWRYIFYAIDNGDFLDIVVTQFGNIIAKGDV